mgnify:CR=1 FL=1
MFILIVFFTLSRQLRSRVSTLLQGAHQLSMGDLSYRLAEQPRDDEINHVARAFNVMAARLADMLENTVRTENLAVLGAFATGVAHEVRNPLTTMKTTVQALLRREEEPERRYLLTDLGKEIDRLSLVTSDLLEYGRPHPAQPEVVAVASLFEQIVRLAGPDDPQLLCETEPGLQLYVDPDQIRQILVNLCLNAFQACDNQSPVRLCAQVWDGQVRVMVIDQGCGISEADLQRIRQPFFYPQGAAYTAGAEHQSATAGCQRCAHGHYQYAWRRNSGDPGLSRAPRERGEVNHRCLTFTF